MTVLHMQCYMDGMSTSRLRRWRDENEVTQEQLESLTGIDQSAISRWEQRKGKPGRANAVKIEKATGGAVTAASWDEEVQGDAEPADCADGEQSSAGSGENGPAS